MNETEIAATIAGLIGRVEALEAENVALSAQNAECAESVGRLVRRIEDLTAINEELRDKSAQRPSSPYRTRPSVMRGRTVQSNVGCGPLYITLNEDDQGRPFEVFFKLGKSGSCQQSYLEALGVAISVGLRYGADPQKFIDKFEGMRCPNPKMRDGSGPTTLSCADGISQGLAQALRLALPLEVTLPDARSEAVVISVAEPKVQYSPEELHENEANRLSLDLIGTFLGASSEPHGNGNGSSLTANRLQRAMQTGVGLCPKCSGPLISQGGCIQCLQQCGYVGKCS